MSDHDQLETVITIGRNAQMLAFRERFTRRLVRRGRKFDVAYIAYIAGSVELGYASTWRKLRRVIPLVPAVNGWV